MSYSQSKVTAEQRKRLQAVAAGMLRIYETLAEMRYLDPLGIVRGPHDLSNLKQVYSKFELDPAIVYLYSILPYIDNEEGDQTNFFHGSQFADFRDPASVERGRDPLYYVPPGDFDPGNDQYMAPWATPLSLLGNHGTVLIYDAMQHRIWAVDQESGGTTDPALLDKKVLEGSSHEKPDSDWGDDSTGDYEQSDEEQQSSTSEGSSEFWSDDEESALNEQELVQLREDQNREESYIDEAFEILSDREQREAEAAVPSPNNYSLDHVKSRPAEDVLRDINQWFRELKEGPGFTGHADEWSNRDVLKSLYLKNGWPSAFDGDSFEVDQARAYCAERAKWHAEDPLRTIERHKGWLDYVGRDVQIQKQKLVDAKTDDEKWTTKFRLWQAERRQAQQLKELREARDNVDLKCPGGICQRGEDLPLWELEMVRKEEQGKRRLLRSFEEDPALSQLRPAAYRHAKKCAAVYAKAYQASLADAERLCPGRTFEQATGFTYSPSSPEKRVQESKWACKLVDNELLDLRKWAAQVPVGMVTTMKLLEDEIEKNEKWRESTRSVLEREEKWLAEHGNTD